MFRGVPIIGISGGVGAGKSFVAGLLVEMGCVTIASDDLVRAAYSEPAVRDQLRAWWGDGIFAADSTVDRSAVAVRVFGDREQRKRLETLLHPRVAAERQSIMSRSLAGMSRAAGSQASRPRAFVWDSPLLFETGLARECDVTLFVDAPAEVRQIRVLTSRGWSAAELARRENSQMGLDNKRQMSNYLLVNTADAEHVRGQLRTMLPLMIDGVVPAAVDRHSAKP